MWYIVNVILLFLSKEISTKHVTGRYECGEHGKFEYCLEGVPGCVIGCHCHPGYYFDTDSKICEPNNKLSQNYRKHNTDDGPTRRHFELDILPTRVNDDEFTTVANINDKLNDDLGDWLYNQFFKTVENQVLNETSGDPDIPARRSNTPELPSRRSKTKKGRKKSKKRRKSKKDRRRKLLKIPADDPIWETSGESDSDSSSSSSDKSRSSSESSSGSKEEKKKDKDKKTKKEKKPSDHDHSKFLIIKKQPKPPLPSFIFLPNVDTPYYPPVGIAAAAAMPMFPMVPVPPMLQCTPGSPDCNGVTIENSINTTAKIEKESDAPTTTEKTKAASDESEKQVEPSGVVPNHEVNPNTAEKSTQGELNDTNPPDTGPERMLPENLRKKIKMARLNRLQQKAAVQLSRRHHKATKVNMPVPIQTNLPVPTLNEGRLEENVLISNQPQPPFQIIPASKFQHRHSRQQILRQAPGKLENIKYLSQLIRKTHALQNEKSIPRLRGDFNNMILQRIENQLKSLQTSPEEKIKQNNQILNKITNHFSHVLTPDIKKEEIQPSRRMFGNEDVSNEESDAYYSNLGRQIASVIKGVYPNKVTDITPISAPVFNENNLSARSYWERAVRSPTTRKKNEVTTKESLYDLEDKVQKAATDVPFLSLPEIENIISMVSENTYKHDGPVHVQVTHEEHNKIINLDLFSKNANKVKYFTANTKAISNLFKEHASPKYTTYKGFRKNSEEHKSVAHTTVKTPHRKLTESHGNVRPLIPLHNHHKHHHRHHHDHNDHDREKINHSNPKKLAVNKNIYENENGEPSKHYKYHEKEIKLDFNSPTSLVIEMDETTNAPEEKQNLMSQNDQNKPNGYNIDPIIMSNLNNDGFNNPNVVANINGYNINPDPVRNSNTNINEKEIFVTYPNTNVFLVSTIKPTGNKHEDSNVNLNTNLQNSNPYEYPNVNSGVIPDGNVIEKRKRNSYLYPNSNHNTSPNEKVYPYQNAVPESSGNENTFGIAEAIGNNPNSNSVNIEIPRVKYNVNQNNYANSPPWPEQTEIKNPNLLNTRRAGQNDSDSYRNYLPRPYTELAYNIENRRRYPSYPYPAVFKGARIENQKKPIWTGFPGRGLRPYKKPQTPSFRSALFFDDFI